VKINFVDGAEYTCLHNCERSESLSFMLSPTPLQSFIGGLGLAVPVYTLLLLNGNVFGISGFIHRAALGEREAITAVTGLVSGGALVGIIEGGGVNAFTVSFPQVLLSGFLVGLGSKVTAF
jgi:uncharacterized protein